MSQAVPPPVSGWLILHKPLGITSAKAVASVKHHLGRPKIGHTGTLDPLASGVLPLAIGEATKLTRLLQDATKEYLFSVQWGVATDTDDLEGKIIARSDVIPSLDQINAILSEFTGEIEQVPPAYSAVKIDGKRAYDLARAGEEVICKPKTIKIHDLSLENIEGDQGEIANFHVKCGKGTYVRSLARDIAKRLGTCGHVVRLVRSKVGRFSMSDAILLETLGDMVYKNPTFGFLWPLESVLDDIPVLAFSSEEKKQLYQGKSLIKPCDPLDSELVACCMDGKLFGLAEIIAGHVKPVRMLNRT